MKLSLVTVNWNGGALLGDCLASAAEACRGLDWEHWVVDNASTDGSADAAAARCPHVRWIRSAANEGFGKACNRALAAGAAGDFVLFLNPDTRSGGGAIRAMARFLDEHPGVAAVTCSLSDGSGRFQEAQGHRLPTLRTLFNTYFFLNRLFPERWFPGVYWAKPPKAAREVEWISGAAMMVRRSAMDTPFFDESYFLYAEDMEASAALRRKGWALYHLPEAGLSHAVKASVGGSPSGVFRTQVTSQALFLRRHMHPLARPLAFLIMTAGHALRALLQVALALARPGKGHGAKAVRQWRLVGVFLGGAR